MPEKKQFFKGVFLQFLDALRTPKIREASTHKVEGEAGDGGGAEVGEEGGGQALPFQHVLRPGSFQDKFQR